MDNNHYLKQLTGFDPKNDLKVNENFRLPPKFGKSDALSELQNDYSGNTGKEFGNIKTSGPLKAGLVKIENNLNKTILVAGNDNGELILFTPTAQSLKEIAMLRIQGSIISKPTVADGIIYVTTREGFVYAINSAINEKNCAPEIIWQQRLEKGILAEPIATGKILIVTTMSAIYGFEAYYKDKENKSIGRLLWKTELNGLVSSPIIDSGTIFIGSRDKNCYALEYGGSSLSQSWSFESTGEIRAKPYLSKTKNSVLFATITGNLYCLDRKNGQLKWHYLIKAPILSQATSIIFNKSEYFYIGADNGIFYCLNNHGKKIWEFKTNGKIQTEPLVKENRIYFGSADNNIYGVNAKNGNLILKFATDGNINDALIIENDLIFFGSTDSFVYAVYC